MKATLEVRYTDAARDDLLRLFDFLLERARTIEDFDAAQAAIEVWRSAIQTHPRTTLRVSTHGAAGLEFLRSLLFKR